jgi:hypothetical protein
MISCWTRKNDAIPKNIHNSQKLLIMNHKVYFDMKKKSISSCKSVATPLWSKCEDETHTPKSGNLESFGTPKNAELDCKGQNRLHWRVLCIIEKVLKCRCRKWPCMSHSDICNTSYDRKKGRESNWQFDSWSLKVGNRPNPDVCR